MLIRFFKILFLTICFAHAGFAQTNPEQWFDTQYTQAIEFCNLNNQLIDSVLSQCCVPTNMALAVAFPEMLRYTLWRDMFETTALELLYVNYGKEKADFSIGWLQMKPSFAEMVEQKITTDSLLNLKYKNLNQYKIGKKEICLKRKERVQRLKNFTWQLQYLCAFIDVSCKKLQTNNIPYPQFLNYLAAAYNSGMNKDLKVLSDFSKTKTFPYGPGRENPFGYCELANSFYRNEHVLKHKNVLKTN